MDIQELIPAQIKEILEDEQKRMYALIGTFCVVTVLYLLLFIVPSFSKVTTTTREIRDLRQKISLVNDRLNRITQMTKQLNDLRVEVGKYSEGLPAEKEIPNLLKELSSIAKASKVKILSITPTKMKDSKSLKKGAFYKKMGIVITANSGYHQLGQFINNLEDGKRYMTIKELSIRGNPSTPRSHVVKIVLDTYVSQ